MITDKFDIDEAEMLRDVQIEDESGCDIRAGINHGANLGNYLFQKINAISYDQLKEILNSKTGKVLLSEDVDEIVSEIQSQMLITDSAQIPILATAKSA
jgi:hypothetical protein